MYHKWQSYDIWLLRYQPQQTDFFVILSHFLPFYPPKGPKRKTKPGDLQFIIILQKRTKNHDHMLCCFWDLAHDRCNCYFSFWAIFCPFTQVATQKMKISRKMKKKPPGGIIIPQKCTKNHDHMLYCSCDMARDGHNTYFSFWAIFCPFTPLTNQKTKTSKKWKKKKHLEIS